MISLSNADGGIDMEKKKWIIPAIVVTVATALTVAVLWIGIAQLGPEALDYGFARTVPPEEEALRRTVITTAERWLGSNEADGSHRPIIDLYNSHTPLAQGYEVQYDDDWCATFVSAVSIQLELTDIIPTECGCQRQIGLFQEKGCWVEDDAYVPLPGDIIYYCMDGSDEEDCTKWSDHVGIVVGTAEGYIKVIEGNASDDVAYRYIQIDAPTIRGFAAPDFTP